MRVVNGNVTVFERRKCNRTMLLMNIYRDTREPGTNDDDIPTIGST